MLTEGREKDDRKLKSKHETEKSQAKEKVQGQADVLKTRTGGAYIPPAKLKLMQEQMSDKSSKQYQRINWERLKKRIHRQVNIVNTANLVAVVRDLLQENIIRGKGLLARSIIQAQAFSPAYSNVYAALVAVINSKFPHIGELILRRLIVQFKRSFRRNDKATTVTVTKFLAHLVNQQVLHEVLALELMVLMLENPTEDSVEVTVAFLKECGAKLTELSPRGVNSIFDRLRSILTDADIDRRVQYMIEVIYTVRRDKFRGFPAVVDELDLIDEEDQITHTLSLEDPMNPENELNVFKFDPEFEKNESMYEEIRKEIVGDGGESFEGASDDDDVEDQTDEENEKEPKDTLTIIDGTEQSLVAFRRNVYLTIQSSLDFQEAAHKLLKIDLKPGQDVELCNMIVDCCAQQRTYENFYGLLAERFCRLRKEFQDAFERIARDTYNTIHRFEITKLRNMARLVAHLLSADAISWSVLEEIFLNEDDTTSAGRIYIKILFQEIAEFEGVEKLMTRIRDPTMQNAFEKILPRDNPVHTRFSINFFTSIGLGYLTMDLREHLKRKTRKAMGTAPSSFSSSSSSSDSDFSSDLDASSGSSSSSMTSSSGLSSDEFTGSTKFSKSEVDEVGFEGRRHRDYGKLRKENGDLKAGHRGGGDSVNGCRSGRENHDAGSHKRREDVNAKQDSSVKGKGSAFEARSSYASSHRKNSLEDGHQHSLDDEKREVSEKRSDKRSSRKARDKKDLRKEGHSRKQRHGSSNADKHSHRRR